MNGEVILIVAVLVVLALIITAGSIGLRGYSKSLETNRTSNLAWLQQNGKRITAYVMDVKGGEGNSASNAGLVIDEVLGTTPQQLNRDIRFASMGSSTYHVSAQWTNPETQKSYTFYHTFTRDELPKHYTPGSDVTFAVTVLIDPNNPKHYVVELPPRQ